MSLINDFSEIERFASFLRSDYQEKFLNDIDSLLVKYINEQKGISSNTNNVPLPPPPKPAFTPPPPPPPAMNKGTGTLGFKPSLGFKTNLLGGNNLVKKPQAQENYLSLIDTISYFAPKLTEKGKLIIDVSAKPSMIEREFLPYLKQVDGFTNLKLMKMIAYTNLSVVIYLEKVAFLTKEEYITIGKSQNLASRTNLETRLGQLMIDYNLITNDVLETALSIQRGEHRATQKDGEDDFSHYDAQTSIKDKPKKEKLQLGEILMNMKKITYQQLVQSLDNQKWLKNKVDTFFF